MSLPNLDQNQRLSDACPSAIFVAFQRIFAARQFSPCPGEDDKVSTFRAKLDDVRTLLYEAGIDLDAPNQAEPYTPGGLTTLHPVHIQTIENLAAKVYDYAAGNAQIEHLKQQAESVANIMDRLKAGTLKGPVENEKLLKAAPEWTAKMDALPTVTTPSAVPTSPPMVKLTWRDSAQPIVGWRFTDDLPPLRSVLCESIGYVVAEDGENIMLAQSIGDRNEKNQQANACMVIPKCCIVERIALVRAILDT